MSDEKESKKGYQTTEFWLSLLAILCGVLMSSGLVEDSSAIGKGIGAGMALLATLGYQASRTTVKKAEAMREVRSE
jgi:hypothetical protein